MSGNAVISSTWPCQNSRDLWNRSCGLKTVFTIIFKAVVVLLDVISWRVMSYAESPACFVENDGNLCLINGFHFFSTLRLMKAKMYHGRGREGQLTPDGPSNYKNVIYSCHMKQLHLYKYTLIPKLISFL